MMPVNVRICCGNTDATRLAYHRRNAAALARDIRAMWPGLKGDWTRRDWNQQALAAAHNHVAGMLRFDRANGVQR